MPNRFRAFLKKCLLGKDQNLISIDEPYGVMRRLLQGRPINAIIDAGASDGHVSRRMLRHFPRAHAYAFEPNEMYRQTLLEYAAAEPRFHPQFLALGDRDGTAELQITESPGNASLCIPSGVMKDIDPAGTKIRSVEAVELVTIDSWIKRSGLASVEVMKFDIQGGELAALEGGRQTLAGQTLAVYIEVWFNQGYDGGTVFGQTDLFLRQLGYVVYDIYKPGYNRDGMIMWANALYLHAKRMGKSFQSIR